MNMNLMLLKKPLLKEKVIVLLIIAPSSKSSAKKAKPAKKDKPVKKGNATTSRKGAVYGSFEKAEEKEKKDPRHHNDFTAAMKKIDKISGIRTWDIGVLKANIRNNGVRSKGMQY